MPYSLKPPSILYPPVDTPAWVVISRLEERPTRTAPNPNFVNQASEIAIPLPTGRFPEKKINALFDRQMVDDLSRPLYDDGLEGTIEDTDIFGNPLPPMVESTTETRLVTLQEDPRSFSLEEVLEKVVEDFLNRFTFYDWGRIITFDSRYDSTGSVTDIAESVGFGAGAHPLFLGPILGKFSQSSEPKGHLLLVAPEVQGIDYYLQIRHGIVGPTGGKTGPIEDFDVASRQGEIFVIRPMENFPISQSMLTDGSGAEIQHFWIRTRENGKRNLQKPYPVIPYFILLGRSTGDPE